MSIFWNNKFSEEDYNIITWSYNIDESISLDVQGSRKMTEHEKTTLMAADRFYRCCLSSKQTMKVEGVLVGIATTSARVPQNPVMRSLGMRNIISPSAQGKKSSRKLSISDDKVT